MSAPPPADIAAQILHPAHAAHLSLYYAVILGLAALYATVNRHSSFGRQFIADLPFYLTYTANFVTVGLGIVWSLATEEQFYLIWPSIEKYCARMLVPLLALSILLNQLFNFPAGKALISHFVGGSGWTQLNIFQTTFTPILLGVGAAHLLHSESGFRVCGRFAANRWASTLIFLGLIALISSTPRDISGWPRLAVQLGMTAWLVSCVYREDHALRPLLTVAPARQIGKISYGMYLFHIQLIVLAAFLLHVDPAHGSLRLFVLGLSITVGRRGIELQILRRTDLESQEPLLGRAPGSCIGAACFQPRLAVTGSANRSWSVSL